jgi:heat shock protein HspQ
MSSAEKTHTRPAYHVLVEDKDSNGGVAYIPIEANVEAASAKAAIHQVAKKAGRYVAVPARSFQPVTVIVETQTIVRVG